jgi:hypothetical protein
MPVTQAADFAVTHQFQANTPAVADEVNTNFSEVAAAINALSQRVVNLEAAVNATNTCAAGSLSGAYKVISYNVEIGRAPNANAADYIAFSLEYARGDLCLKSNNTWEYVTTEQKEVSEDNSFTSDAVGTTDRGTYTLSNNCQLVMMSDDWGNSVTFSGTPSMDTLIGGQVDKDDLEWQGNDVGDSNSQRLNFALKTTADLSHQCKLH